ncbi:MAG: hydrogenase nickel incorporation protein HypB [Synergistaceae bacterium]|jgi:hydrogenase nickel incorporation protein HypB|nr:hydrogenase nickel incorporation protein HypB [Synergistaceae bacterium]
MTKIVTIQQAVMAEDEKYAFRVRQLMKEKGILVLNVIGSPGCGKTTLLEEMAGKGDFSFAVIEGDLETSRDAERLASRGINALQINTRGWCHLEAHVVEKALESLNLGSPGPDSPDALFIENVGNLVCPAEFDLGEDLKIAVSSTPEGADKPLKYPLLFVQAGAVLLTKTDLLPHVRFDREMFMKDVRSLNPKAPVFELDLTSGVGLDKWISFVSEKIREKRSHAG